MLRSLHFAHPPIFLVFFLWQDANGTPIEPKMLWIVAVLYFSFKMTTLTENDIKIVIEWCDAKQGPVFLSYQ